MNAAIKPAASVAKRMTLTLAALAPVVVVESLARGVAWITLLLACMVLAMGIASTARPGRGDSKLPLSADLDAAVAATLVLLLLPAGTDWRIACLAIALAVVVGRQAFGGLGQPLFHPAMVGLAGVGLLSHASTQAPLWSAAAAAAVWLGGGALMLRGVLSWRQPLAFLVGATGTVLFMQQADVPSAIPMLAIAGNASWVLCAFFIAGDSSTSCLQPRARLAFGLGAGALVVVMDSWQPGMGLPLAMLLMNFMAPWLDKILTVPSRKAVSP